MTTFAILGWIAAALGWSLAFAIAVRLQEVTRERDLLEGDEEAA